MAHGGTARVGMIGGGQLARMTFQAAIPLDLSLQILAARPDDSAARVAATVSVGAPDSLEDLRAFAKGCDVVTFDHELVEPAHLEALVADGHCLRPAPASMRFAQDKHYQRACFEALGLPVPASRVVSAADDLLKFGEEHGWPVVAKVVRGGYDGRGVWILEAPEEAAELVGAATKMELLAEQWVRIRRELAILVARRPGGEAVVYPVVETVQRDGICHEIVAPAPVEDATAAAAAGLARRIADTVEACGILAVEFFLDEDGRLLVNELATRPHNSGHYSIEGCLTSQFQNHLRAVVDWPLGDPALVAAAAATANVLATTAGDPAMRMREALGVPGVHVHLYGKEARPGRKLGHVTALGDEPDDALERAKRAAAILAG
jgi:5-(carboxyamino)imidazole ribonucleotide synthase